MSTLDKARPCPFCHGALLWFWYHKVPGKVAVACSDPDCGATGPIRSSEAGAIEVWNDAPRL